MNLLMIANKRYETDFRKYLMRAAESAGEIVVHLYAWEEFLITYEGGSKQDYFPESTPEVDLYGRISALTGGGPLLVLTGLGGRVSLKALNAKRHLSNALFLYDVYDNFRYGACGRGYLRWICNDLCWRFHTDSSIILNRELKRLYPSAYHLDNASHLRPLSEPLPKEPGRMVYIGSIDDRVDWEWLNALALNDVFIDIYGQVHLGNRQTAEHLALLLEARENVKFLGSYDNNDLVDILSRYRVGIVPYKVKSALTRYVNPDKFYHYLNTGLEVVSTGFPQSRYLDSCIYVLDDCSKWPDIAENIIRAPKSRNWPANEYTWECRWQELSQFALSRFPYSAGRIG